MGNRREAEPTVLAYGTSTRAHLLGGRTSAGRTGGRKQKVGTLAEKTEAPGTGECRAAAPRGPETPDPRELETPDPRVAPCG